PDCIPDQEHMIVGDVLETIPAALQYMKAKAILAHCDIGSGNKEASLALARMLGDSLPKLLEPGAVIVSDQPFHVADWQPWPLPDGVAEGRYYLYRQL